MSQQDNFNPVNKYTVSVAALVLLVGVYWQWPAPDLTSDLVEWRDGGKVFKYRGYYDIFYRDDRGRGPEEEVLLLIHGFPTSSYDWSKVIHRLKDRFGRIVAPDLLGFGFSAKPLHHYIFKMNPAHVVQINHNYTIFEQATIIQALLKSLNVSKVHIISHDYGDTVAQELLHRHIHHDPSNANQTLTEIGTICLLNGGIFPDVHTPRWSQQILLNPYLGKYLAKLSNRWLFFKELASTFGEDTKPSQEDLYNWWTLLRHKDGYAVLHLLLQYIPQRLQHRDRWRTALQKTPAKVHFVYGPSDPINPHPFAQRFMETFPEASFETLPNVGHYVQWEAADEMLRSYFRFLDAVVPPQTRSRG